MDFDTFIYWDEVNLSLVKRDFKKSLWMILLTAVSTWMTIFALYTIFSVPQYTCSATFAVAAKGSGANAYASLATTNGMANVFQRVFEGDVMKRTLSQYVDAKLDDIRIAASVIPETNLIQVEAAGASPIETYEVVCALMEYYPNVSEYLFGNAVLEVLNQPTIPDRASNRLEFLRTSAIGGAAALLLMSGAVVVSSVWRGTVKTVQAANRRLGGKRLGTFPDEDKNAGRKKGRQGKSSILITNRMTSSAYAEACRKAAFRIQHEMEKDDKKVLLVTSVSENEGKSTIALNLSLAMAENGKRVLLIDLDLRNPSLRNIWSFPDEAGVLQEALKQNASYQLDPKKKLSVLLNEAEIKNPAQYLRSEPMAALLEAVKRQADIVILDSAPLNVAADTEFLMEYADASLLVVCQDKALIRDIRKAMEWLRKSHAGFIGYVLNHVAGEM